MAQTLEQALADFSPGLPFAVAFSGGADSTALLLACAQRWPGQVRAVHIHHGLQAAADDFERHCRTVCERLGLPLVVRRVQAGHAPGQSPEDAARRARYAALAEAVHTEWPDVRDVLLAQHADDQVETLLLALSRGAGLPGLASMPAHWQRMGLHWHRPCLAVPGAALRNWLREQGQAWVEDPSNSDEQFTRNRIRARLLPVLAELFPAFRDTFARSAAHAAQAQDVLNEVAEQDLMRVGMPPRIAALQQLSRARQALVLRHWLRSAHATTPSAAQLNELLSQVAACTTRGHRLHLKAGQGFVQRQGQLLHWQPV
ncbi:MAG: tRNA lysidine(34) synthetase TilS [Limnohabitans sp.]